MYKWDGVFATGSIERVTGYVCLQCRIGERSVRKIAKKKKMLKGQNGWHVRLMLHKVKLGIKMIH